MITLRPYQNDALAGLDNYWLRGAGRNPIISAPTGSGKSLLIAEFVRRTLAEYQNLRVMVLVDSRELVRQNAEELRAIWPEAPVGVYSAGLKRRQKNAQITFAGIQSVYRRASEFGVIHIVIVDECHMIPRASSSRYGTFLRGLRAINPNVVAIGLTATPYRLDSGLLTEGEGALFDGIAYDIDIAGLIADGYLSP
ncbi:MAG: DEAD/DEAH box helicase family protein, partial [Candidatus Marinimicrobia bacterium]|nr:DEAD/DEAH box helicase family protein [Candidatus Neomarinimicrobiota bacterium]